MKKIINFLIITLFLIILLANFPKTYSKYETDAMGRTDVETAYYVINAEYQNDTIKMFDLVPSNNQYVYTFSVANNKDGKRLETRLKYNLKIRATTNLPLTYELYKIVNSEDVVFKTADEVILDDYGTYFRHISTEDEYFSYIYDETNYYKLVVNFPEEFNNSQYQDIVEFMEIIIDSKQLLDGE